jgi:hypothetical protein
MVTDCASEVLGVGVLESTAVIAKVRAPAAEGLRVPLTLYP